MTEWPRVSLAEVAANEASAISKPFGSAIVKEDYVARGVPVVRGVNLARGRFHDDDFVYITEELADRMPGARLQPGDLVFTHRGTVGQVSMIPRLARFDRYATSTSQVKARLDPQRISPEFVYYWFLCLEGQRSILDGVSTVGVPGLAQPVATVKSLLVPSPPLPEQQAIAEVLGALDDKIAANIALGTSVDVYLAGLFEQRFSTGAAIDLERVADVNRESVKPLATGPLRYVDIAAVGVGSFEFPGVSDWSDAPGRARRAVRAGDTFWSTVRPNLRSHALNLDDDPLLVASTGLAVLSPRTVGFAFLYEATKRAQFTGYLENAAEGSAYPAVRAERFLHAPIPDASVELITAFEREAAPLRESVASHVRENRTLAATRDALLPQLMSGNLRVRDAEAAASAADA